MYADTPISGLQTEGEEHPFKYAVDLIRYVNSNYPEKFSIGVAGKIIDKKILNNNKFN